MPPKVFDFGKGFGDFKWNFQHESAVDKIKQLGQVLQARRKLVRSQGPCFPGTAIPMAERLHVYEGGRLVEVINTTRALDPNSDVMDERVQTFRCERAIGMDVESFVLIKEDQRLIAKAVIQDNNGQVPTQDYVCFLCGHPRSQHHSAGGGWAGFGDACHAGNCACPEFLLTAPKPPGPTAPAEVSAKPYTPEPVSTTRRILLDR